MKTIDYISGILLSVFALTCTSCDKLGLGNGDGYVKVDRKQLSEYSYFYHYLHHDNPSKTYEYTTDGTTVFEYDRMGRLVKSTDHYVTTTDGVMDGDYMDIFTYSWEKDKMVMVRINEHGMPLSNPATFELDRGRVKWAQSVENDYDEFLFGADGEHLRTTRTYYDQCDFEWSGSRLLSFTESPVDGEENFFEYKRTELMTSPVQCKGYIPFPDLCDYEFNHDINALLIAQPEIFGLEIGHLVDRVDVSFKPRGEAEIISSDEYEYVLGKDQYIQKMSIKPTSTETWETLEESCTMKWK